MTSEVVILNKKGLVVAADSAVTSSGLVSGEHPRYSKAANKIFDASPHGNLAITIFSNADIDRVPWEVAIKLYRDSLVGTPKLAKIADYVDSLTRFLTANSSLFPAQYLADLREKRLSDAMIRVLRLANIEAPGFLDDQNSAATRTNLWNIAKPILAQDFANLPVHSALTTAEYQNTLQNSAQFVASVTAELQNSALTGVIPVPKDLADLAVEVFYKDPTTLLTYTGLVIAGYGEQDIFPQYRAINVYGHIGSELLIEAPNRGPGYDKYEVTHENGSWIQAFAQSSMIDVFTDGFNYSLRNIIREKSQSKFNSLVDELRATGLAIPANVADQIVDNVHTAFMKEWQVENYEVNFHPLRSVLSGLSIQEMAHLAENLLTLESLKERVTSPSESVGGPIDIAAITKAEGLVWIQRKHYFNADLNLRYIHRA